ncbi:type IV secretion system DNA-binding domain-containing protein [Nocardia terpenica]|uniref:type IV secretory system conjugative DNA transfer family protein n=1 Tax=Nocardia terpenica TaxID=455432 RepID=UPI0018932232|nr:type IV secretion system DNA-binding domain-containing protein [Nocardia terpenica]MBF6066063.1 type IV secretion system DNA-binding domain-containing protein [Nocardia terpenica]MBF6109010.1 type IV secretion system DNA-binding domain-containing protein [Nocardia terpenica]MBF6116307.1 type IV secretion system DNA-binding domain-containing protein [Nocardia terpenica]MBF6123308.1 type IV secretion system DNA-binding domain-containing protein [Nocardia terpenica]MBF6156509.1 type IV secreti
MNRNRNQHTPADQHPPRTVDRTPGEPGRLRLAAEDWPGRAQPKPLGIASDGGMIGLSVEGARHHVHVPGATGTGKSTWLANLALAEAATGRGLAVIDPQGDLAAGVLDRLPASAGARLVILDPAERDAPPAWNVFAPPGIDDLEGREFAAEMVIGTFRKVYAQWWGPRMDEVFRAACLTLARRPGSTLADVVAILTRPGFGRAITARYGEPGGFEGFWDDYDTLTPAQRQQSYGPVISRLRAVLSHRFARDLLTAPATTIDLTQILDGGILIARLPKGEIGDHGCQLVGSLLLSGLWSAATHRATVPPVRRRDATIIVDECHNFLHLPIGVDTVLAEARGYRVSLVLAHQHLRQLPPDIAGAVDANARNKIVFTVSPDDARKLAPHFAPFFDATDLANRPGFAVSARIVHNGHAAPPFSLDTVALPPAVPGRAEALRSAARASTGLPLARRQTLQRRGDLATADTETDPTDTDPDADSGAGQWGSRSVSHPVSPSVSHLRTGHPPGHPLPPLPQVGEGGDR